MSDFVQCEVVDGGGVRCQRRDGHAHEHVVWEQHGTYQQGYVDKDRVYKLREVPNVKARKWDNTEVVA